MTSFIGIRSIVFLSVFMTSHIFSTTTHTGDASGEDDYDDGAVTIAIAETMTSSSENTEAEEEMDEGLPLTTVQSTQRLTTPPIGPGTTSLQWTTRISDGLKRGSPRYCENATSVSYSVKTECKPCTVSALHGCPEGFEQITQGRGVADCTYSQRLDADTVIYQTGCRHTCRQPAVQITQCCTGFWGSDCNECPGGHDLPCSGHGTCSDGFYGNGSCSCQTGFAGTACEQCSPNVFGPLCNAECECVRGTCHDGINGTGSCDCDSGFTGIHCTESLLSCMTFSCGDNNSRCVEFDGQVRCICNHGYQQNLDSTTSSCQPINRCLADIQPCHPNAFCSPTGPGIHDCSCMPGYEGDGFYCSPVDPCQTESGSCPVDSTRCLYIGPGQHHCECLEGYENYTEDAGCQLINVCAQNTSICHEHATCTVTGPWEVECVCESGYVGDGQNCYGNLLQRVEDLNENDEDLKGQFRYALQLVNSVYMDLFTKHGFFTWFLTTDSGFEKSLTRLEMTNTFFNAEMGRQLLRQHLIASPLTLSELTNASMFYMLEGSSAELFYKNKGLKFRLHNFNLQAAVLRGDIIAANGIIHVISQLIDKPPNVIGSLQKSIGSILLAESQYETFFSLLKAADLSNKFNSTGHFTVFAPSNSAWSVLPTGTIQYFLSAQGKGKLISVLKNHFVEGPYLLAADLVNMPRFVTAGGVGNVLTVTQWGRIVINGGVNVTQVDIHASNGFMHHIDGLLTPDALLPLLPHRCDITAERTVRGTCGMCNGDLKCPLATDVPLNETSTGCRYWVNLGIGGSQNYVAFDGCFRLCNRTYQITRCCSGFYGSACNPCPGGFQNPCLGRGKCTDGYYGNGACKCDEKYSGAECEFCSNQQMYGLNCTSRCTCLHGVCDNRLLGSVGRCKPYTCQRGFTGVNCDMNIQKCDKRLRLRCHAFADCVRQDPRQVLGNVFRRFQNASSGDDFVGAVGSQLRLRNFRRFLSARSSCVCRQGYRGSGTSCEEIDRCAEADGGGCHQQANCVKTGPGLNTCKCREGWVGDGIYCYPSTPCLNHSHCHQNAFCMPSTPNQYICSCEEGYHGNGTYCVLNDMCTVDNGGCDINAECTAVAPGVTNCSCHSGYGGDGIKCFSSVGNEVQHYAQLMTFSKLLQVIEKEGFYLDDMTSNYTLLAPNNEAVQLMLNSTSVDFWQDESNILTLLSCHVMPVAMTLNDLRSQCEDHKFVTLSDDNSLMCQLNGEEILLNGAHILQANLPALNGFIHIIDKVLEPQRSMQTVESLLDTLADYTQLTEFSSYLQETDLVDSIENLTEYTVFIPVINQSLPTAQRHRYLSYYVATQSLSLWRMKAMNGQKLNTLLGSGIHQQLSVSVTNEKVYINGRMIVDPSDIQTTNGFIHSLDGALIAILNKCDILTADQQLEEHCCTGYFGVDCEGECPGGAHNPCSRHGTCDQGLSGTGLCSCRQDFTGSMCETCLYDKCLPDLCLVNNGGCHINAICQNGEAAVSCKCREGYEMQQNSTCVYVAGDCNIANGGCSPHATCAVAGIDSDVTTGILCSCQLGFAGDGLVCNGNLWSAINETVTFYHMLLGLSVDDGLINLLSDPDVQLTVFLPVDYYCTKSLGPQELRRYIVPDSAVQLTLDRLVNETILQTIDQQVIVIETQQVSEEDEVYYTVNNVPVIRTNIPATNGIIHLLSTCFTPSPIDIQVAASRQLQDVRISNVGKAGAAVGILVVMVTITMVAVFTRRHWWPQFVKVTEFRHHLSIHQVTNRFRKCSKVQGFASCDVIRFNPTHLEDECIDDNPFIEFQSQFDQHHNDQQKLIDS